MQQIENPELRNLLSKLSEEERRLAELFAQALGEEHVLECIKRDRASFFIDGHAGGARKES